MNVYLRAARDAVATVGAAYIPFSLLRLIAHPDLDIYFVGPVEELLGVIGAALFCFLAFNYSFAAIREKGRGRSPFRKRSLTPVPKRGTSSS